MAGCASSSNPSAGSDTAGAESLNVAGPAGGRMKRRRRPPEGDRLQFTVRSERYGEQVFQVEMPALIWFSRIFAPANMLV